MKAALVACLVILFGFIGLACTAEEEPKATAQQPEVSPATTAVTQSIGVNTPGPTQSPIPTDTPAPTPTPTPTPEPTFTPNPTATPGPLTTAEIFAQISQSLAFVQTPKGNGSGVLVAGGVGSYDKYVVTNAHVVWPFREVRVAFPSFIEYADVPVLSMDLMADLAILGPLSTPIKPLELTDGEDLAIGSDLLLIGYPAEGEEFPQPTITQGILSRFRKWDAIGMTYFQTDAAIASGQSGGVLVSGKGEVIGISGLRFSEAGFGLVASAADLLPRIENLIAGDDIAGLGNRRLPMSGGKVEHQGTLRNIWDVRAYLLFEPAGTSVDLRVSGQLDLGLFLLDSAGNELIRADENLTGVESGSAQTLSPAPHFVVVAQSSESDGEYTVTAYYELAPIDDPDDGKSLSIGHSIRANMDYPRDFELNQGDIIQITVDSANINPVVRVHPSAPTDVAIDNDSGGGFLGTDAAITYRAPSDANYFVVVNDALLTGLGGYFLTVKTAPLGATLSPTTPVEGPPATAGYDLAAMLPTLDDLPPGFSIVTEGYDPDPSGIAEYEREFEPLGESTTLGASTATSIYTSIDVFENETNADLFFRLFSGLEPSVFGELFVQGKAEETGNSTNLLSAESFSIPSLNETALGFRVRIASTEGDADVFFIIFTQGPFIGALGVEGPIDEVSLEDVVSIAQLIVDQIDTALTAGQVADLPPAATPVPTATPTPTSDPPLPIYGPVSGQIIHDPGDRSFETFRSPQVPGDYVVEATFINPYPITEGNWTYGLLLHSATSTRYQEINIRSNRSWSHRYRLGSETLDLRNEVSSSINIAEYGKNHIRLMVVEDEAWLYINEAFEGNLDLSALTDTAHIRLHIRDEKDAEATRFENFTIWEWNPELDTIPVLTTPTPSKTLISPTAATPSNYIPSTDAQVTDLKFYETPQESIPYGQRAYSQVFNASTARAIAWELHLTHPAPGQRMNLIIDSVYHRSDGSVIGRASTDGANVSGDATGTIVSVGTGWDQAGNWPTDTYRVDLFVEGELIAGGEFEVKTATLVPPSR